MYINPEYLVIYIKFLSPKLAKNNIYFFIYLKIQIILFPQNLIHIHPGSLLA